MKMTFYVANCRGNAKNSLYPKKCVVDNEDDCMEVMAFDHVCGEFKGCRRGNDNFLFCDASVMDCDNSHSDNPADWIHPEDLEEKIGKLVMRNGNAPFDLDYNLMVIRMPEEYWNNPQCLKNRVRDSLNLILRRSRSRVVRGGRFSDGKDSTSVITALMYTPSILSQVVFSFDLAILAKDEDGTYYRLIHDKRSNNYHWGEAPAVHHIRKKADAIKSKRHWDEVRERYKYKKNMYLERQDKSHPSYIVYVETINEIYRKYFN